VLAVLAIREVPLRRSNDPAADATIAGDAIAGDAVTAPGPATQPELIAVANGHAGAGPLVVGRVLRGDGRPLAGASVTLTDVSGQQVDRTRSGADGDYLLRPTTGGTYLLIASAPQLAPNAAMVAVATAAVHRDVVLSGSGSVRGCVRSGNGRPLAAALVTLTDVQGEVVASTATGPDGRFRLGELMAGTYTLTGQASEHQPVPVTVDVTEGAAVERDILLVGAARVTGVVRAASDRRPLREATVTLLDGTGTVLATTRTGGDGGYAFEDLLPGSYTLTASGFEPVADALRVPSGGDVAHDMTLGERGE
jgi:hypothetical protein